MLPELCLGTVQMGLDYGITNVKGRVPTEEVIKILDFASRNGIKYIDTAQSYGCSETAIGKCSPSNSFFKLISKMSPQIKDSWAKNIELEWENLFINSLKNLNAKFLDSFLLHQFSDLLHPEGNRLLEWIKSLKERGLVKRIGVSIYSESDLDKLPIHDFQIVQLPLSLYDQRLIQNGTIRNLNKKGIAIHVRSIFLQGLILNPSSEWPKFFSPEFITHHKKMDIEIQKKGISKLEIALEFVKSCKNIEAAVFGVTSLEELRDIYKIWNKSTHKNELISSINFDDWAWGNNFDLDPRKWNE